MMDWAFCTEWDGLIANVLEQYLWGPVRPSLICKHGWLVWKQRPDSNGVEEILCDDRWKLHSLIKLCLMEDLPDRKHAQLRTNPLLHGNGELSWYEPTAFSTAALFRRLPFPIHSVTMKKRLSLKWNRTQKNKIQQDRTVRFSRRRSWWNNLCTKMTGIM